MPPQLGRPAFFCLECAAAAPQPGPADDAEPACDAECQRSVPRQSRQASLLSLRGLPGPPRVHCTVQVPCVDRPVAADGCGRDEGVSRIEAPQRCAARAIDAEEREVCRADEAAKRRRGAADSEGSRGNFKLGYPSSHAHISRAVYSGRALDGVAAVERPDERARRAVQRT